ncbi:type VI secretion system protein TssA [Lysobacter firmicutimachus]|uniref:Type VI secretion system protein TssA n=1 Tax=Lysobacter firmicutimachus TaxID=1792846 RepID=A0AAU8MP92_9GAMM
MSLHDDSGWNTLINEHSRSDSPCGDDLEYDEEYLHILRLAAGREERQSGTAVIPAEPPDWNEVERRALQLSARTKDLRIALLIARAKLECEGVPGLAQGLELTAAWLDRYWTDLHPRLDALDEHDPLPRLNAVAALNAPEGMVRSLRNATLLRDRRGATVSVRDAAAAIAVVNSTAVATTEQAMLIGQLRRAHADGQADIAGIPAVLASLARIKARFALELGAGLIPDFGAIEQPLHAIETACAVADESPASIAADAVANCESEIVADAAAAPSNAALLQLRSRRDVATALEMASAYLERHEPSHPAPLLIRRALRLMDMSFYDIVRELAPASLAQVETVAGIAPAPAD